MFVKFIYIRILVAIFLLSKYIVICGHCGLVSEQVVPPVKDNSNAPAQIIQVCWNDTERSEWNLTCFNDEWNFTGSTNVFCHQVSTSINTAINFTVLSCTGNETSLQDCIASLTTNQCDFISKVFEGCNLCGRDDQCIYSANCSMTEATECVCQTECSNDSNKNNLALVIGPSSAGVILLLLAILAIISITVIIFNCLKQKETNPPSLTSSTHSNRHYGTMPYETSSLPPKPNRNNRSHIVGYKLDSRANTYQSQNPPNSTSTKNNEMGVNSIEQEEYSRFVSPPNKPSSSQVNSKSRSKYRSQSSKSISVLRRKTTTLHDEDLCASLIAGVMPPELTASLKLESGSYVSYGLTVSGKSFVNPPRDIKSLRFSTNSSNEISKRDLVIEEKIANGQFGIVYRASYTTREGDVIPVAAKTLIDETDRDVEAAFRREVLILDQFQHPNILKLIGFVSVSPFMIVTELLKTELGALLEKLRESPVNKWNLPPLLIKFCVDIAAGMCYLANMNFIHRDLAARNVLVSKDLSCRIADFGMSRQLKVEDDCYTSTGGLIPLRWSAPEAVFYKKFSEKSDVWAFGMTMYEIWALGRKPWASSTNDQILTFLSNGVKHSPPTGCDKEVYKLMWKTWHTDQAERPEFSQILVMLYEIQLPPPAPQTDPVMILGNDPILAVDLYKSLRTS